MLKTELEVIAIGEPNLSALTESERRLFFETLYARVLELAKEKKENKSIVSNGQSCNVLRPLKK